MTKFPLSSAEMEERPCQSLPLSPLTLKLPSSAVPLLEYRLA